MQSGQIRNLNFGIFVHARLMQATQEISSAAKTLIAYCEEIECASELAVSSILSRTSKFAFTEYGILPLPLLK